MLRSLVGSEMCIRDRVSQVIRAFQVDLSQRGYRARHGWSPHPCVNTLPDYAVVAASECLSCWSRWRSTTLSYRLYFCLMTTKVLSATWTTSVGCRSAAWSACRRQLTPSGHADRRQRRSQRHPVLNVERRQLMREREATATTQRWMLSSASQQHC